MDEGYTKKYIMRELTRENTIFDHIWRGSHNTEMVTFLTIIVTIIPLGVLLSFAGENFDGFRLYLTINIAFYIDKIQSLKILFTEYNNN